MKKVICFMLIVILVIGLLSVVGNTQEPKKFKCGSFQLIGVSHEAKLIFKKIVEERSKGMLIPVLYIDGEIGSNDEDNSTSISEGTLQLYWGQDMMVSWAVPEWQAYTNVPFCFRDNAHCQAFWSSEIGDLIQKKVLEKYGVLLILDNLCVLPARVLTANKPIYKPEDLKGLKFRAPLILGVVAGWEAAGANVTSIQWGELFGALQTGIVDAQENPLFYIKQGGLYQVQKYIMLTNHQIQADIVHLNYKWWLTLSEEEQNIILDAIKETNLWCMAELIKENEVIKQEFKDEGLIFVEHSKIDIQAFKDKIAPVIREKFDKEWAPGGWEKIQSL